MPKPIRNLGLPLLGTALACLLLAPLPAPAADELPSADSILERYVEVTGGRDAYEAYTTRLAHGKLLLPAMGLEGKMTIYQKAPDLMRMVVELPGMGTIAAGYDGETAWESNPMTGPRILEGAEKAQSIRDYAFNAELKWKQLYESYETTGKEMVDSTECYDVVLTPAEGQPETRSYAIDSGLLRQTTRVQPSQMGDVPVVITSSDYKEFGGILLPTRSTQKISVQEMAMVIDDVEMGADLPEDAFDLPTEVQALMADEEGGEAGADTGEDAGGDSGGGGE